MCSGCLKIWRYLLTIYARYKERNIQIPEQSAAHIGISLGLLTGLPLSVLEAAKHANVLMCQKISLGTDGKIESG